MSSPRIELANAIRALSMDAVQKAKSGHPGAPMGMADIAEVLWNDFLRHTRQTPLGLAATALCCPMATARCCSTRCCTFAAMNYPFPKYKIFAKCTVRRLDTRNMATPQV